MKVRNVWASRLQYRRELSIYRARVTYVYSSKALRDDPFLIKLLAMLLEANNLEPNALQ